MYHSGDQLIDPQLLFTKAHLRPGMHVGDLGCGRTGHLVFPAATILGEHGVLYAVDVMKDILDQIARRARLENLLNVHTVWSDLEQFGRAAVPEKSLDAAFVVNTLTHSKRRENILNEALRLMKDKARCIIVDWKKSGLPFAPADGQLVNFDDIKTWARAHGLAVQEEFSAGDYHRGVVLFKG